MSSKNKTTATKEEAMPDSVPKLRFPAFREEKGWENRLIGPYLEDCSGRVPPDTELPVYSSTREGLKRQDAYFDGRVLQNNNEYGMVPPGCFVYRHMSDDGLFKFNINETGSEIAVSKEYPVFSTRDLNPVFLLAKLNDGLDFKNFALSQKAGGTRTRLYFSRLCEWRTLLPSTTEQQEIAECLSSVGELLVAQARKVSALKIHKKALIQQLFPREGETKPRLRFPEFQDAGEWAKRPLGDYFDPIRNGFVGTATPYYTTSQGVRYLQGRNIKQGRVESDGLVFVTSEFHIRQRKSHLKIGDILMVQSGHVGECAVVRPDFSEANCHALIILTPKLKISSEFFVHYFYSPIGEFAIFQITTGNTIKHILASELKNLSVLVPDLAEQQRIASCLSCLDALIAAEAQKLEALKTQKKGLMQQLFPSSEGVDA
jgi:type I restriction enzyme S subunit